jgi:hypothetical protein
VGSFALEAPEAKKVRKPKSESKPKSIDGEKHQRVVEHYHQAFLTKHGVKPIIGGAEGSAVKRLLEKLKGDEAEACRRIENGILNSRRSGVTILVIAKDPSAFASADAPLRTNGRGNPQQATLADADEVIARYRAKETPPCS